MTDFCAHQGAITVLSWNANKIKLRDLLISSFLSSNPPPDVIVIQEPGTSSPSLLKSTHAVTSARDLLIYHKPALETKILLNTDEASIIQVGSSIFGCYLRNGSSPVGLSLLLSILDRHRGSFLVIGDLNTKLSIVSDRCDNPAGRLLMEYLANSQDCSLLNDMQDTFHRENVTPSMLDICLARGYYCKGSCITLRGTLDFSDHTGILFSLSKESDSHSPVSSSLRYADYFPLRSRNLHRLRDPEILRAFSETLDNSLLTPPNGDWVFLRKKILQAMRRVGIRLDAKKSSPYKEPLSQPAKALLLQRKSTVFRSPEYNKLSKMLLRQLRRDKRDRWTQFVKSIGPDEPPFSLFRRSQGRARVSSTLEKATQSLQDAFKNPLSSPDASFLDIDPHSGTLVFTLEDLRAALKSTSSSSSPGPDGIPYNFLKALGPIALEHLLAIYNSWCLSGMICEAAKHRLMQGIPKPDGGVRGLTLTNSALKIYERLLLPHLESIILPLLPDFQYGFRKGMSSAHQALRLLTTLEDKSCSHLVLFYDVKKAFDRVDRHLLLSDLASTPIDRRALAAVQSLLLPSPARVILDDKVSDEFTIRTGVPQGGILSPILFNFYLHRLGSTLSANPQQSSINFFAYADDIAIVISSEDLRPLFSESIRVHEYVCEFFQERRLELNMGKSGSMLVTKLRPHRLIWPEDNLLPPRVLEYKYLGCIIDAKLTLKSWCTSLVHAIRTRVLLIKRISSTRHLSRRQIEALYTAVVRGKLNYACSIWSRSIHAYKVLNADINGQRITMAALIGTSLERIQKESSLTPFSVIIARADLRLYLGIRQRPSLHLLDTLLSDFLHPLNDSSEHTTLYSIGTQPYLHGLLNDSFTNKDILDKLPPRPKRRSRRSFKNEVYLARFRMGKIPTRFWAASMRLCDTPLCRHCDLVLENDDHWFFDCSSIDYSPLILYNFECLPDISDSLNCWENTFDLENAILRFIYFNDLFRVSNASTDDDTPPPLPPSTPKRGLDISPAPSRLKKRPRCRSMTNRKRTTDSRPDQQVSLPKRQNLGHAPLTRTLAE